MINDRTLSFMKKQILTLLSSEDRPMTKREIATSLNISFQTVSSHINEMLLTGKVIEYARVANAMKYTLGNPTDSLLSIYWRGKEVEIIRLIRDSITNGEQTTKLNAFAKTILGTFADLLYLSAESLDDDNPKPISLMKMKNYQSEMARLHKIIKEVDLTLQTIVDNDRIWHPQNIANELIIRDPDMNLEIARDLASQLKELLVGKK